MEGRKMQKFPNFYIDIPFVPLRFHPIFEQYPKAMRTLGIIPWRKTVFK